MSKELRAFSKERQALDELYDVAGNVQNLKEDYIILKSALQRLEAIDNANPSEALKELECLYANARIESGWVKERCITYAEEHEHNDRIKPYYESIKQSLIKAQEQEKENAEYEEVLKLVFDRKVDIYHLSKSKTVEDYNSIWDSSTYCLTEEEFDLLKRWIEK